MNLKLQLEKTENSSIVNEFKQENSQLLEQIKTLKQENIDLKSSKQNLDIIDLHTDSMYNLYDKVSHIRRKMCLNFLVDFIAKQIMERGEDNSDFEIKLTVDTILEKYREYIQKHKFTDIMYNEDNEKGFITIVFDDIPGIKKGFTGKINSKIFYIGKISNWICKNVNITPKYINIFKEFSKHIVFDEYCEILNSGINAELKTSYSFLVHLLIKFKNAHNFLLLNYIVIKEEYTKFMLQFDSKIRKATFMFKTLLEIDGIVHKHMRLRGDQRFHALNIDTETVIEWINDTLEISEKWKTQLNTKP